MKKIMGTTALLLFAVFVDAQPIKTVKGIVMDATTKEPIADAIVYSKQSKAFADEKGNFTLKNVSDALITISCIGYKSNSFVISNNNSSVQQFQLTQLPLFLQPLEVRGIRASNNAPFTKTNMNKKEIAKQNLGQDIPFLLNQTPSVVINSDAGNGVGYTAMRIRGTDATRINVTLNGIPYNDAESMGTYFVDLPDFSSSVNSIQIQRGAGTSSNGTSAFGATINMSTNEFNEHPHTEINNSFGSFNTFKNTIKAGSGLIGKHFTIDARISSIRSDGYVERAASNLKSFYLSSAYINKKTSLRLNIFSGGEKTYQAWYGINAAALALNRTYNPAGTEKIDAPYDNQTDNYTQTHYQLFLNQAINDKWSFNTALFLTKGKGYYEEYKANQKYSKYGLPNVTFGGITYTKTDLVRQKWLVNNFYGQIASFQYKTNKDEITIGGGWTTYEGEHFGNISWLKIGTTPIDYKYYNYPANKSDINIYTKWQHQLIKNMYSFIDLQYRPVTIIMNGFKNNPILNINRKFKFFNPKAGLSYNKDGWQSYLSFAIANKEPNRDDFEESLINQPTQETLQDWELGTEKKTANYSYGATFYYMNYLNQLVLTGKINDIGSYTRINIPSSYRAGIELQGASKITNWANIIGNITISKNKIKSFSEFIDNYDNGLQNKVQHENKDISFSSNLISSFTLNFIPIKNAEISLLNKYVGKQYLDNTENDNRSLNAFFIQDLRGVYILNSKKIKEVQFIVQINNFLNKKYEPNGYITSYITGGILNSTNYYYPMAGRNFMLAINWKFHTY